MLGSIRTVFWQFGKAQDILKPARLKDGRRLFATSNILSQNPELTSLKYKVSRGPYATITDSHLQFFENLLGKDRLLTDPDECDAYNVDWGKIVKGCSRVVARPKTTEEVSAILRYCNDNRLAVCPQSGRTGLVWGSVPVFDEIVLSMGLMNHIIEVDKVSNTLVCQAGCVLEALETHLNESAKLIMPLDLGAKGSCQIGGCVSTNAGGLRLMRYGNLHGNVLGLEAVKANGEIIDCLNTLKKDNTGYHLKHLFIGSEGTLGVVTKVAIQCPPLPNALSVVLLGLNNFDNVLKAFELAKCELAEILSACEMMDHAAITSTNKLGLINPLATDGNSYSFYMLMETAGSNASHDEEKLNAFLEKAINQGIVENGTVATEPSKVKKIWELRERIAEGVMQDGYTFNYDFSMRVSDFYKTISAVRERIKDPRIIHLVSFGHLGDGNLHMQITIPGYIEEVAHQVEPFIYEYVSKLKGSVSAEHGIGFQKIKYLHLSKDESAIKLMHEIKQLMDPNGILNPYKVLPSLTK